MLLVAAGGAPGAEAQAQTKVGVEPVDGLEWRQKPEFAALLPEKPTKPKLFGFSVLPDTAPTAPKDKQLGLVSGVPALHSVFTRGWPFEWIWSPLIYVQEFGERSAMSGVYALTDLYDWEPVWLRVGAGALASLAYSYDVEGEEWNWKTVIEAGGELKDLKGGSGGAPVKPGKIYRGPPQWQPEVIIKRRRDTAKDDDQSRDHIEGMFRLLERYYVEGMPVYQTLKDGSDTKWLFSHMGRWILARSASGMDFSELADSGFFDDEEEYGEFWLHRSKPHEGQGPDVEWEPAVDGKKAEIYTWLQYVPSPSLLQRAAEERLGVEVRVEAVYPCR